MEGRPRAPEVLLAVLRSTLISRGSDLFGPSGRTGAQGKTPLSPFFGLVSDAADGGRASPLCVRKESTASADPPSSSKYFPLLIPEEAHNALCLRADVHSAFCFAPCIELVVAGGHSFPPRLRPSALRRRSGGSTLFVIFPPRPPESPSDPLFFPKVDHSLAIPARPRTH